MGDMGMNVDLNSGGGHFYDPSVSITARNLNRKAAISFVGAKLNGDFFQDDIRLDEAGHLTVKGATFGKVENSTFFSGKAGDLEAVIGMGYPSLAENGTVSLPDEIMQQKTLESQLFSFYLSKDPSKQSEVTFGYYDRSKFTGEISWNAVV